MTVATVLVDSLLLVVVKGDSVIISLRRRTVETDICTVVTYDEQPALHMLTETFACETV